MQEEQVLMGYVQRLTNMSDLSLGIIGAQGVARTATGARTVVNEASANIDIFLQRLNAGWKSALRYLWHTLQNKVQAGFAFRVVGLDGSPSYYHVKSREELAGMYDFELDGNSANSNPQTKQETAQLLYQMTANPIDLQLGLVSPLERYEAIRNYLIVMGIKDVSRYVRKPSEITHKFTPVEVFDRLLNGLDVPLDPRQDLEGIVAWGTEFLSNDETAGQVGPHEMAAIAGKVKEAEAMLAALQQAQAQQANIDQQSINTQATQTPGQLQSISQAPPPPPEGAA
jgi:hypothetical protein